MTGKKQEGGQGDIRLDLLTSDLADDVSLCCLLFSRRIVQQGMTSVVHQVDGDNASMPLQPGSETCSI